MIRETLFRGNLKIMSKTIQNNWEENFTSDRTVCLKTSLHRNPKNRVYNDVRFQSVLTCKNER